VQCDNLRCLFRRDDILQKSFAIFDEAKNGLISEQDLINVTNQKGLQSDTADIHRMILEHDSNGDGKIDFQEVSISPVIAWLLLWLPVHMLAAAYSA